jgi:hypothetical protein
MTSTSNSSLVSTSMCGVCVLSNSRQTLDKLSTNARQTPTSSLGLDESRPTADVVLTLKLALNLANTSTRELKALRPTLGSTQHPSGGSQACRATFDLATRPRSASNVGSTSTPTSNNLGLTSNNLDQPPSFGQSRACCQHRWVCTSVSSVSPRT